MESQIVYRCTGTCGGVSPEAKNCGMETCTKYNQPLQAVQQCEGCAAASAESALHACDMCAPA